MMEKNKFYLMLGGVGLVLALFSMFVAFELLSITGYTVNNPLPDEDFFPGADLPGGILDDSNSNNSANTNNLVGQAQTPPVTNDPVAAAQQAQSNQQLTNLKREVTTMKTTLSSVQAQLITLKSGQDTLQQDLSRITANVNSVTTQQQQIKKQLEGQLGTLTTGLASVQQNVESTKTELEDVETMLEEKSQKTRVYAYAIIILVILGSGIGVIYYLTKVKGFGHAANKEVVNYITSHIKRGLKFAHVRENLLKAGWSEHEIKKAYHATIKKNYKKYKRFTKLKIFFHDKQKILVVAGFVILLVLGMVFLFKGVTTGQAYQFYGGEVVNGQIASGRAGEGVADYEESVPIDPNIVRCPDDKVLINGACCRDFNNNNVCDNQEGYREEVISNQQGLIIIEGT